MNPQLPGPSPVALIADDDIIIRMFAREALEQAGWTVEEADNGFCRTAQFHRFEPSGGDCTA